jgi:tetratricopeptide (TPR) repeat protein
MFTDNEELNSESIMDQSGPADITGNIAGSSLKGEPAYLELLIRYQNAEWNECENLLGELLNKYPDDPVLVEIREDIRVKQIFQSDDATYEKEKKKQTRKSFSLSLLVIAAGILLGLAAVVLYFTAFSTNNRQLSGLSQTEKTQKLQAYEEQTRNFLRVGNTEMALTTIEKIKELDPYYAPLVELSRQADQLKEMDLLYNQAVSSLANGNDAEALEIFRKLVGMNPSYKDVKFQVEKIEQAARVDELLALADSAYSEMRWADVIAAYEEAMVLKPNLEPENLEEQLFTSYYQKIREILSSESPTITDIDTAEAYYYKAVALVAQDKAFTQERRELQQFLVSLLNLKYRQIARAFIDSPFATEDSISKSVDYLRKALSLSPGDARISSELDKAQTYLLAMQKFNRMEWDSAITNLEKLSRFQSNYANGMVKYMLYEAYSARGIRLLSAGYFLDARKDLEKAEIIAWEVTDNKLQRFEAQVNVGLALGKMYDYTNAVKYFSMALDSVGLEGSLTDANKLAALQSARQNAEARMDYNSYEAYALAISDILDALPYREVSIAKGQNLASISLIYSSTAFSIREKNGMPDLASSKSDTTILAPYIP